MEEKNLNIKGLASNEQISAWKEQYKKVFVIEIVDGEDKHIAYFHRPTMQTMSAVVKLSKTDEIQGSKALFDNCFISGSPDIKEDAILFIECSKQLSTILNALSSTLKNL